MMRIAKSFFSLIILISYMNLSAQIDNSKVVDTDAFVFQPEEKNTDVKKSFNSIDQGENITLFGTLNDISNNFPKYEVINKNPRRMQDNNPVEKDVLVKKFWNGQDVSNVKVKTKLELGKLETSTKKIRIECRDHSYVDGDRVRLYVNEKVIRSNIILQAGFYMIDIDLKEGFNRIDIEALNQGTSGPNTAEFRVFDGNGNILASNEWNILTGYVATLVVTKN